MRAFNSSTLTFDQEKFSYSKEKSKGMRRKGGHDLQQQKEVRFCFLTPIIFTRGFVQRDEDLHVHT